MNKISVALSFLLLAVCTSFAQINEKRYTISDCITSFSDERVIKNKTGWAFWFIPADGIADTLSVKMSCVDKGIKTHEPHSHFEDELFYMVEGTSVVHLNGEEHVLNQGDAFYAPGSSSHNIRRVDDKPIRYLMFKREIRGKLSKPFLLGKKNYSMKDCLIPFDHSLHTPKRREAKYVVSDKRNVGWRFECPVTCFFGFTSIQARRLCRAGGLFYTGRESGSNG